MIHMGEGIHASILNHYVGGKYTFVYVRKFFGVSSWGELDSEEGIHIPKM